MPACHNNKERSRYTNQILFLGISLILIVALVLHLRHQWTLADRLYWNTYYYSEFLINYQGGFVRRGLLGEVIYQIASGFEVPVEKIIWTVSYGSYGLVLLFLFYKFIRKGLCWWIILSPFLCGLTVNIIRKDYLCYCVLIGMIWCLRKGIVSYSRLVIAIILGVLGLLIHESFIFYGVPAMVWILFRSRQSLKASVSALVLGGLFIVLCVFRGSEETALSIIDSWNAVIPGAPIEHIHDNSIGTLTWNMKETFTNHFLINFHSPEIGWWLIGVRVAVFLLSTVLISGFFITFRRERTDFNEMDRANVLALYLGLICCLLPMFLILSCDFGRLYQYAFMTVTAIYLLVPREILGLMIGERVQKVAGKCACSLTLPRVWMKCGMIILLLFLCSTPDGFNVEEAFYTSPAGCIIMKLMGEVPPLLA